MNYSPNPALHPTPRLCFAAARGRVSLGVSSGKAMRRLNLIFAATAATLAGCPPPPAYTLKRETPQTITSECARKALEALPGVTNLRVYAPETTWYQLIFDSPLGPDDVFVGTSGRGGPIAISAAGLHKPKYKNDVELEKHRSFSKAAVDSIYEQCAK